MTSKTWVSESQEVGIEIGTGRPQIVEDSTSRTGTNRPTEPATDTTSEGGRLTQGFHTSQKRLSRVLRR